MIVTKQKLCFCTKEVYRYWSNYVIRYGKLQVTTSHTLSDIRSVDNITIKAQLKKYTI